MEDNKKEITVEEVFNKLEEMEKQGKKINTLMNIEGVRHDMSLAREEQYHKGYCKAVEDMCNLLKALDSQKQC